MKSKNIKYIGLVILALVMVLVVVFTRAKPEKKEPVYLDGYLGGEKIGIFEDDEIAKILLDKYGVVFDYQKAGSYDMIVADHTNRNYLFPASQAPLELYKKTYQKTPKSEIIYNTPLVIYSRPLVVKALVQKGVVSQKSGVYYVDMNQLTQLMLDGLTWADIGVPELYGSIVVDTTDPSASNSGNMFAALLANIINGGQPVTAANVDEVAVKLKKIYDKLGYMQTSSADMFSQFLKIGVGANPMIAGYENQLLEFAVSNPDTWNALKNEIIILYPTPTVWSTHVYIALDKAGEAGIEALLDSEVQRLSWTHHGFRTGANASQETGQFNVNGVAKEVTSVTQLPDDAVMEQLIEKIK